MYAEKQNRSRSKIVVAKAKFIIILCLVNRCYWSNILSQTPTSHRYRPSKLNIERIIQEIFQITNACETPTIQIINFYFEFKIYFVND